MGEAFGRLAYLVVLLVAVGGILLVELRARPGRALRLAAAWVMVFLGLVALAGIWDEIRASLRPGRPVGEVAGEGAGRIEVPLGEDGHFHLPAEVNGVTLRFVVDTGATTIALGQADARRVGIDPDRLAWTGQARTANGTVRTAAVTLDSVVVGGVRDRDVPALVLQSDLDMSLMGMSYLSRFARVSIEGERLVMER